MKKYIISAFFLLFVNFVIGQHQCHNDIDWERTIYVQQLLEQHTNKNYNGQTPMVRLALHNVRKTNGTGGNTWTDIRNVVQGISAFYNPHNICFTVISEDNIDDNAYFNLKSFGGNPVWEDLITENRVNNAINVYFVRDAASGGRSTGSLFVGDNFPTVTLSNSVTGADNVIRFSFDAAVLAHELGHCLGLFHTHELTEVSSVLVGEEIPRTGPNANCTTIGDLLCDTPADPGLGISATQINESNNCAYIGGATFNGFNYAPDTRNIMSYTLPDCMQWFTTGQGNRMRNLILNSTTLDDFVIRENTTVESSIAGGSHYYGVEGIITSSAGHIRTNVIYEAGDAVILEEGFYVSATSAIVEARIGTYNCLNPLIHNEGKIVNGSDSEIPTNELITDKNANTSSGKKEKGFFNKPLFVNPNPFTNTFNLEFELEEGGETSLIVYDALGRVVETVIVNDNLSIGKHQYQIDGTKFGSGVYYVKLNYSNGTQTIKIIKQ
jgi:hypothetical protein